MEGKNPPKKQQQQKKNSGGGRGEGERGEEKGAKITPRSVLAARRQQLQYGKHKLDISRETITPTHLSEKA